ncbi:MAG TPA: PPC domain-containing DNA-binding protein [Candidatus Kapabacteria bacterium]|jgi:hypothetical protein|nr:PPC domain-containing DNA-binding protein [Candidatus Kapabacteria bacterium]
MQSKEIIIEQGRRYILIMDKHDEVISELQKFAETLRTKSGIPACSFTAIGGFEQATLAYFDRNRMVYDPIPVGEQVEVLSLIGNITESESKPKVHTHAILGKRDGSAIGGHLMEGYIWPTLEIMLDVFPVTIERFMDEETRLPLIRLS